jgi:hypothetical protein
MHRGRPDQSPSICFKSSQLWVNSALVNGTKADNDSRKRREFLKTGNEG